VLFWVNLARKDKQVEPTAKVVHAAEIPTASDADAIVRTLVGPGSPVELGTAGLILDIEVPKGGGVKVPVDPGFQRIRLDARGRGVCRRKRPARQTIPDRGPRSGGVLTVSDARPGTRFMFMAGKQYGETPIYDGPYVD